MHCDKHFGLINLSQIRLKGNITGDIKGQVSVFVIASIHGSENIFRLPVYIEIIFRVTLAYNHTLFKLYAEYIQTLFKLRLE
jgi:hypothetical protein